MRRIPFVPILIVAAACASEPSDLQEPPATLVITTTALPDAVPNVAYSATLMATGGDGSYTWSVTVGSLPIGLLLDTRTGEISGMPPGLGMGFTVQVASGDGQTVAQQLRIAMNAVLTMTSPPLPNGVETVAYSETLTAIGGDGSYTWSVTVGSLPTGLSLHASTGTISGTPPMVETQNFTLQVASGDGQTVLRALTITVNVMFLSVIGGGYHSCGVTARAAYCWGWNASGQLGDGTNTDSNVPVAVAGGLTFQSVSAHDYHSCGVTMTGAAYCWGTNRTGQLGDGTNTGSNGPVAVSGGLTFQSVTVGRYHSCGVTTAAVAYCWGQNFYGELGDGTNSNSNVPVAVAGGFIFFQSVTAGADYSCGVTTARAAYCWGRNGSGELGDGTNTSSNVPVVVSGGLSFQSVTAGDDYSCGMTMAGAAYCWGKNRKGQLGDGTWSNSNVPVAVLGGLSFQSVTAGWKHSCGVTTAGDAYCWGSNIAGRLGYGNYPSSNVPVAVLGGLTFQSVTVGRYHSCGTAGAAYCWGWNASGQLGDGTNWVKYGPVRVSGP